MAHKIEELLTLGFSAAGDQSTHSASEAFESQLNFSGYGEYTPISISTKTKLQHANMERDQSRN